MGRAGRLRAGRGRGVAAQQGTVGVGPAAGGGRDPLRVGVEVGQQLRWRQGGPQLVEGGEQVVVLAHRGPDVGEVAAVEEPLIALGDLRVAALAREPVPLAAREHVDRLADEGALGVVVRAAGPPRAGAGLRDEVAVDLDRLAVDEERQRAPRQLLAVADRGGEHLGHVGRSLARRRLGGLRAPRREARVELADRREQDAGLAERGQHLLDVAQERRVGPDDEHAALRELAAVGVEQVGRAVQRHGGLAGAGAALDDQDPVDPGADDPVLLGLDRRDDVAHAPGAPGGEGGQERRLTGEATALRAVAA